MSRIVWLGKTINCRCRGAEGKRRRRKRFTAVAHEPSVHPKRRKAENEDENEGCRLKPEA
jgi:hypothetical protein